MLAFTFPGQGSQRPGMGRPWADHPSWELIGEASSVTDRDLGRLLLDADADELKDTRNAQLTTFVLQPDGARRGRAPRHRARLLRRPQPRRVHRAHRQRGAVVRGGPAPGDRAGRRHARRRPRQPRHDGRRPRPRRRPGRGGLQPGRPRRVGRQLQRPRPGGHRRLARGRQLGQREGQGARCQAGDAPAGQRGVPHAVHGPGPRPAAQGHLRGQPTRHRGAHRVERRCPPPRQGRGVDQPAVGPALQPGPVEAGACSRWLARG